MIINWQKYTFHWIEKGEKTAVNLWIWSVVWAWCARLWGRWRDLEIRSQAATTFDSK